MKKLILIVFLIWGGVLLAQVKYPESNIPEVSDPIIEEFIQEALQSNALLTMYLEKHLKGIYFLPEYEFKRWIGSKDDGRAGCIAQYHNYLMDRYEPMILIDSQFLDKPETLKAFIWHELGHFFGLDHDDQIKPAIMNSQINGSYLTQETVERFFRKIKMVPPYKYRSKISLNN